jgi:hypothetical protein
MAKKCIALIVLGTFSLFNFSCYSLKVHEKTEMDPAKIDRGDARLKFVTVVTKKGRTLEFQKKAPARIVAGSDPPVVSGLALQYISIDKQEIRSSVKNSRGETIITTRDGRVYTLISSVIKEDLGKLEFSAYGPVTVPLSDIQQVWILKSGGSSDLAKLALAACLVGIFATTVMIGGSISKDMDELGSCPFVYSFDGGEYMLDAEPYGSAISEGLKRTDWVELPHLRAVDGKYRVLLTNELDETQYTDELKLVAVDHAPGVEVAPGLEGRLHTFDRPLAPMRAADGNGRDILTFVAANDRVFWVGDLEGRHPDESGDFRDELVFEFPKPDGAAKAKLLANVWTTMWASISAGKYLELYGSSLGEAYRDVDRGGPMYHLLQSWMDHEELYRLKIWVETPEGWRERGAIWGGAPVVTQDKAYLLDIADVPGETLRIKLRPPVNFWMVNSLAVDYGEDLPVQVTELAARRAVDHTGRDVRAELAATDGLYHVSPNPGERTELEFAAPPVPEGLERTVLVKASGYYKVHLDTAGAPQAALIARVIGEPGFAARYSFRKYLEREAALLAEAALGRR